MFFRLIVIDYKMKRTYINELEDPLFLGSLSETVTAIHYENQKSINSKKLHICKQTFMTISSTIYTQKDYFLIDELNLKIKTLNAAGLIQYWHDNYSVTKRLSKEKYPKVIEMRHLFGCFQLWCMGLGLSFIVFSYEVLSKRKILSISKQCLRKLLNFMLNKA
jgi:hypothetical protein